jgi:predicted nucleic acid-binding protein
VKTVFVDTGYLIALINKRDSLHLIALEVTAQLGQFAIITTDLVLVETLNYFAERGQALREEAVYLAQQLIADPYTELVVTGKLHLVNGLALYRKRKDKGYSLTDCVSIGVMRDRGLSEALAYDTHFLTEGFVPLLRRS